MGVIPMGEHYKSIFLSVIILADKVPFRNPTDGLVESGPWSHPDRPRFSFAQAQERIRRVWLR